MPPEMQLLECASTPCFGTHRSRPSPPQPHPISPQLHRKKFSLNRPTPDPMQGRISPDRRGSGGSGGSGSTNHSGTRSTSLGKACRYFVDMLRLNAPKALTHAHTSRAHAFPYLPSLQPCIRERTLPLMSAFRAVISRLEILPAYQPFSYSARPQRWMRNSRGTIYDFASSSSHSTITPRHRREMRDFL